MKRSNGIPPPVSVNVAGGNGAVGSPGLGTTTMNGGGSQQQGPTTVSASGKNNNAMTNATAAAAAAAANKKSISAMMEHAATGTPLDYSFMELVTLDEILEEDPFAGTRKPRAVIETEGDAAAAAAGGGGTDASNTQGGGGGEQKDKKKRTQNAGSEKSNALRLSNNYLESLVGFSRIVKEIMWEPENLSWLDLSFNKLKEIPKNLGNYEKLSVLYLHANCIPKVKETEKLATLTNLRSLTLHGNPMESVKYYRLNVIGALPTLRSLDFSSITNIDRDKARMYKVTAEKQRAEREEKRKNAD